MRFFVSIVFAGVCAASLAGEPAPARQAELLNLLKHDCGSCHGMTLQGGLGPALTPEALAGKPASFLQQTILDGRHGTPMPPWKGMLSPREVAWLVNTLQQGKTE